MLVSLGIAGLLLAGCSSGSDTAKLNKTISSLQTENSSLKKELENVKTSSSTQDSQETTDSSSDETSSDKTYGLNEEAILSDSSGNKMYGLKILKATTALTETDDFYTNGKPENTVQITYEYTNYNYEKPLLIRSQFIETYYDNQAGDTLSMMDGQTEVTKGRSSQTTIWSVMQTTMTDKNEVEIEYVNDFSTGFEGSLKFKVPVEH